MNFTIFDDFELTIDGEGLNPDEVDDEEITK